MSKYLICIIIALFTHSSFGAVNLDTVFVPGSGTMKLKAGETYTLSKTKSLRSCNWVKDGVGPNPIVNYTGARESAAFNCSKIDTATISDININGVAWTY